MRASRRPETGREKAAREETDGDRVARHDPADRGNEFARPLVSPECAAPARHEERPRQPRGEATPRKNPRDPSAQPHDQAGRGKPEVQADRASPAEPDDEVALP